ncbi:Inositol 2-dehydrogenase/D-chiro-inositol 3-dehydrogenase [Methylobacterium gregans]|uniref:Inositol 2-dehydrogenase/D-chiro-inositol 3-dehydrogenase n=2 Tax=Methylobacterium gregans TaxID=374424 RepID=A0AA37HR80_9HYPH|nr:NAD-dependent epimerase/dehydratase family protein [Methylobacterium gregans]MDQ0524180.1 putative dehydrogenase/nucleoside-diphosphate-sugar epimerase [Methylobacterium gregans]GJD80547.1 Inositol 2-dehydrogenase/D-chiro-inositol 3-dehydrogenase [Methylobacterium gregans]
MSTPAASPKARLAIIGCGAVVDHHLLPALKRQGWAPSVLVDRSPERLALLAGRAGRRRADIATAADWREVADRFDAALVATPHTTHGPIGLGLLEAGKHVFMEKPLATTSAEGEAMIAAASRKGLVLAVGLLRRNLIIAAWTKALIASGTIGAIRRVDAREGFVFNWATSSDALLRRDLSGGGVLMDTGAHTLDILGHWFGTMTPTRYRDDGTSGVEADCVAEFLLDGGGEVRVELSRTRNLANTARIEGTHGHVEVALYRNEVVAGSPNALAFTHAGVSGTTMKPQLFPALFDAEMRDFRDAVADGRPPLVGGDEGLASVRRIEGCYALREPLEQPWDAGHAALVDGLAPGARVVVTGASGFIGGRLVERLVRAGIDVTCIIREIGSATRLARLPVRLVKADLTDPAAIGAALRGADTVFHCAYDPRSRRQNLEGARVLIGAAAEAQVRRLVHVSTFSVYEPFPPTPLTEETRDGDRAWIYVKDKLDIEGQMLAAARDGRVPTAVVQPTIVYGPFCKPWTNAPAEELIYGEVVLPDGGAGRCSAVFVDDLVDGMLLAATRDAAVGERFILSGPDTVSWGTFFSEFARALGVPGPTSWPLAEVSKQNQGFVRDVKLVLRNPKRIVQIIVRWPPARSALQAGLDALPKPLRALVDRYYFGSGGPVFGALIVPDPQKTALYTTRATAEIGKARRLLGYAPRFAFADGMRETTPYLVWAYADLVRAARRARGTSAPPAAPVGTPVADAR